MLELYIKDVFEGLLDEIKFSAEEIAVTALTLMSEYRSLLEQFGGAAVDRVMLTGRNAVFFQKEKTFEEIGASAEGSLLFDAQLHFLISGLQVKFYLNLVLTGDIEEECETSPQELFEQEVGAHHGNVESKDKIADNLVKSLESDMVNELVYTSTEVIADSIVKEMTQVEELDRYK